MHSSPTVQQRGERLAKRRQQVLRAARRLAHPRERPLGRSRVALRADAARALDLAPLGLGVEPQQLDRLCGRPR